MTKANPLGIAQFDAAEYLKDEESVAEFLNASIEMNDPTVLLNAVTTVARARSMSKLAEDSGLGRESLYKALKPGSQPRYETVMKVLGALGVQMVFRAPAKVARPPAKSKRRTEHVENPESTPKHASPGPRRRGAELRASANGMGKGGASKPHVARRTTS